MSYLVMSWCQVMISPWYYNGPMALEAPTSAAIMLKALEETTAAVALEIARKSTFKPIDG